MTVQVLERSGSHAPSDARWHASGMAALETDRYPILRPKSEDYARRVEAANNQLAVDGCCVLKGLVQPDALPQLAAETEALAPKAHFTRSRATVYGGEPDATFPEGHPRRLEVLRDNGFVAGDHIADGTLIRSIYHNRYLQQFLASCMGMPQIHEFADPLAQLVVNVLQPGTGHGWHFDTNEFVVTLLTNPPERGGRFEYCPQIRTPRNENDDGVANVLAGGRGPVKTLDLEPGDLQIFYGRYSLHRVTAIEGVRDRHTVIFAYAKEPGMLGNPAKTRKIFGRVDEAHSDDAAAYTRDDGLTD